MPNIIDDRPAEVTFYAYQGSVFPHTLTFGTLDEDEVFTPMNLAGYTIRMQIRKTRREAVPVLELSTTNGRIVILDQQAEATKGKATIKIAATEMSALAVGTYLYDLETVPPSGAADTEVWLKGSFVVEGEVTRA